MPELIDPVHSVRAVILGLVIVLAAGCRDAMAPLLECGATVDARSCAAAGAGQQFAGPVTRIINFDASGNSLVRFDAAGNAIDAHGGEVHYFNGTYYWYGEHYSCGFAWITPGTTFCGFRVYTSPNLIDWSDAGQLFDVDWVVHAWCDGRTNGCFRPHVAYNAASREYVLWINSYDATGGYLVFTSSSPAGPFRMRPPEVRVSFGTPPHLGDANLFVDEDGTAYVVYTNASRGGDLIVEELTPDYFHGTGRYTSLGLAHAEAPSMFKRDARYYITFSDPNCGFCTTGTSYMTAPTPLGPWGGRRKISSSSCGGQPTHVSRFPATDGGSWYMYQSDHWSNGDVNEATAGQVWTPLAFDTHGEINPLLCAPSVLAPIVGPPAAPEAAVRGRLVCDVGGQVDKVQREFRFVASTSGVLTGVRMNAYQRGSRLSPEGASPELPLVVETYAIGPTPSALARVEFSPDSVSWSAQRIDARMNVRIEAGRAYSVRVSTPAQKGCYGLAYAADRRSTALTSFASRDGGQTWSVAEALPWLIDLEIVPGATVSP